MGIWLYPMLVTALIQIVQTGRVAAAVGRDPEATSRPSSGAILVLGALNAVMGLLGTAMGVFLAAGAIESASAISPQVVWSGIRVALSSSILGLLLLAIALVSWLVIRAMEKRRRGVGG
jgi:hypothetical protein